MSSRYFVTGPRVGQRLELEGDEAHHLAHVMRGKIGEEVILFDGQGREWKAEIVEIGKRSVELNVLEESVADRELRRPVTLAVALPKGDRQRFLLEKLVEVGVDSMIPLHTARSVAGFNEKVRTRLEKQVIEACKQCGRNRLMEIAEVRSVEELAIDNALRSSVRLLADPRAEISFSAEMEKAGSGAVAIAVGPEGGFTPEESERLVAAGWLPRRLGHTILRIETAALAAAILAGIGADRDEP